MIAFCLRVANVFLFVGNSDIGRETMFIASSNNFRLTSHFCLLMEKISISLTSYFHFVLSFFFPFFITSIITFIILSSINSIILF